MKYDNLETKLSAIFKKSQIDNIPYVRENTMQLIIKIINDHQYKKVLEIGTAYGYSAASIALNTSAHVTTIEKSSERFAIAKDFLEDIDSIKLLNLDCNEFMANEIYDLIFIDGPKTRQIDIFNKFSKFLAPNGLIIIDNIFMNKFKNGAKLTTNQANILLAVKKLEEYLTTHKNFNCNIINIDDGVAIIEPR